MATIDVPAPGSAGARRRRRRWSLTVAVSVVVLATVGVVVFSRVGRVPVAVANASVDRATVLVQRTDLVAHIEAAGTIGYGEASPVVGRKGGTLTWLPTPGTVIGRGARLYGVDGLPVPLFFGDMPMYRQLTDGVEGGPDVLILQNNLAALGYSVGRQDGKFRSSTAAALKRWQKDLKLPATGELTPEDVVVLPGPVRVDSVTAALAGSAAGPVLKVTGTDRMVSTALDESQSVYAKPGAKATVELAGGAQAIGTVRAVEAANDDSGKTSKIDITISLDDSSVASTADAGPVTVRFNGTSRKNVLAVPVEALLALREGGYAVEVVDGGDRLIAVTLGLFADGLVEVSGTGLTEGARVVTAS